RPTARRGRETAGSGPSGGARNPPAVVCCKHQRDAAWMGNQPGRSSAHFADGDRVLFGPRLRVVLLSALVPPRTADVHWAPRWGRKAALVVGGEMADDGKHGWDVEVVGGSQRPRTAHPPGPYDRGDVRVLVAGWEMAGDGELRWDSEGVARSR